MASRAITINQSYQPKPAHSRAQHQKPTQIFPQVAPQQQAINPLKSITTVLSQALSTKDQQSIQQLLVTASPQIIANTVEQLGSNRLSALLQSIQVVVIEQNRSRKYTEIMSVWLGQLLKKNIGHIINSPQLQSICGRISRIIKKRASMLQKLRSLAVKGNSSQNVEVFTPKFHYIEQQNQVIHNQHEQAQNSQSQGSEIRPEDLQNLDQFLMGDQ